MYMLRTPSLKLYTEIFVGLCPLWNVCVSFSVLVELSLEEEEVEGGRSDLKEDVQEGKTVFVRSVVVSAQEPKKKEREIINLDKHYDCSKQPMI